MSWNISREEVGHPTDFLDLLYDEDDELENEDVGDSEEDDYVGESEEDEDVGESVGEPVRQPMRKVEPCEAHMS